MIKIYNKNNNLIDGIEDYENLIIEQELNISDTLLFNIPKSLGDIFEEEGYIETKEGRFVIKEKNLTNDGYEIVGKYDLEELLEWVDSETYVTEDIITIGEGLLEGTDWSLVCDYTKPLPKRTVTGTNLSILEFLYKTIDTFKYDIRFNNISKTIYVADELGVDKGVYFHDEVNLTSLTTTSDTYDFATRLIPIGFDGMGIELINDGRSYVEDHTYSDKIITKYWSDERYTVIENLKSDAEKRLEELAKPLRSYSADVQDLSRYTDYTILAYETGDTITLIDKDSNTKEKQRIIKKVKYLDEPEKDSVVIANRPRYFGDEQEKIVENLRNSFSITKASLELFEDSIQGRVSTVEGAVTNLEDDYEATKEEADGKFEGLENNLDGFREDYEGNKELVDARIIENVADVQILATEISEKVSRTEYDTDYNLVNSNYTEFKQDYESFKNTIQIGGGSNLIKNSVGYGELSYWEVESGEIDYGTSTWILEGASKHGWIMSDCIMHQGISLLPDTEYTISGRLIKNTQAGTVKIGLYDANVLVQEVVSKGTETFNGQFSLQFNTGNTGQLRLKIATTGVSTSNPIELTDLMLGQGQNYDVWSQASGEIYTLDVRVDGKGINVYSADGNGKTVMSPEEFAGYYNNQKVFTLNGDLTEVMGLTIKDKGLFIPPVKFVQTGNSLDVVWTGR